MALNLIDQVEQRVVIELSASLTRSGRSKERHRRRLRVQLTGELPISRRRRGGVSRGVEARAQAVAEIPR